jgi:hypothetical protein
MYEIKPEPEGLSDGEGGRARTSPLATVHALSSMPLRQTLQPSSALVCNTQHSRHQVMVSRSHHWQKTLLNRQSLHWSTEATSSSNPTMLLYAKCQQAAAVLHLVQLQAGSR